MPAQAKPATPLPWSHFIGSNANLLKRGEHMQQVEPAQDAAYIVHACNAYPALVEALRVAIYELGMQGGDNEKNIRRAEMCILLRSLGEAA